MEYYPAMTKNEIIPFAPTWMELEFIILSEVSQTNTVWYLLHVESKKKKNYKNELIYTAETGLQTSKPKLGLPNGKGGWGNTL